MLKKEIKLILTEDLNIRYCRILERAETLDAEDIPITDAKEILWIEDILHERLIKAIGHDFYPPDRIEKEKRLRTSVSNERNQPQVKLLSSVQTKPETTIGNKIKLKVTVKSSIGTKVAEFDIEVDSKNEADLLVGKEIRKLGLKGTTYKLS